MSSTPSNNIIYFVISFALLFQTTFGSIILPFHSCSGAEFSASDPFGANLNKLLLDLIRQTPHSGFGESSSPSVQTPNQVYGLALCRGDVSRSDCATCVAQASSYIRKSCPSSKQGKVWYDNCGLKYSDIKFFGQIDQGGRWYLLNKNSVSNPKYFNKKVRELLSHLAKDASAEEKMYSAGELDIEGSIKLYGMAQCTRDLYNGDCKICLDAIIGDLPNCCSGRIGGRIITGSCNIRYETYPFLKA